jgi:hypothetical protein
MLYFYWKHALAPAFLWPNVVPVIVSIDLVGEWLSLVEHLVRDTVEIH